jgi:UDP-N-acetylglucosamine 2-epimerase (non-hydrolysing)
MKSKIVVVMGTRPEAIKMAPVILALKRCPGIDCRVLATAQHRALLDQVLETFHISADIDLDIMCPDQSLATLTAQLLLGLDEVLRREKPDAVLAQGDTTTVMSVALACFYLQIPFGHVEAGLRTGDMSSPFPEEMNRIATTRLARWHFTPTESARQNLLREAIADSDIFMTGNTVIDALLHTAARPHALPRLVSTGKRMILVTAHRRENHGLPFEQICRAMLTLARRNPDIQIVFPVHPNPQVQATAHALLSHQAGITLCAPQDYTDFVSLMKHAYLILSDSGGIQEEAPALGKPVLVLRHETERQEAVTEGVARLVGTRHDDIVAATQTLLDDADAYRLMARGVSPYGDGHAATRIARILENHFAEQAGGTRDRARA